MSRLVKTVEVELGGEVRQMRLTFAEILRFKKKHGADLLQGLDTFSAEQMLGLVHVCLQADAPDLTMDALAEMMDMETFEAAMEAIRELMPGGDSSDPPTA